MGRVCYETYRTKTRTRSELNVCLKTYFLFTKYILLTKQKGRPLVQRLLIFCEMIILRRYYVYSIFKFILRFSLSDEEPFVMQHTSYIY